MKFVIVFIGVIAIALAAPPQDVQVLRYESDVQPEAYSFDVETSDGKIHREQGELKDVGTDHAAIVVQGAYSFVGDDGQTYTVNYRADENGFQPVGDHLPQAPAPTIVS